MQPINYTPVGEILLAQSVGQVFVAQENDLRSIGVLLATYKRQVEGPLVFHLQEMDSQGNTLDIVSIEIDIAEVQDNSWKLFSFLPIEKSKGKQYYFYLEAPESEPGHAITAWSVDTNLYHDGTLMLNHEPVTGDLSFILYYVKQE